MSDLDKLSASADVAVTDDLTAGGDVQPEAFSVGSPSLPEVDEQSSSDDEDDGEVEIAVPVAAKRGGPSFCLKGGSAGFSSRSHCIFDSLDSVAKLTASGLEQDNIIDGVFARPLPPVNKKPRRSPPRGGRPPPTGKKDVPDYMLHPERWTYYNLEDVAETSERSNSRVAHEFLASLKKKNKHETLQPLSPQPKMVFSRRSRPMKEESSEKLSVVKDNKKGMHLSHLEEEDDEEVASKEREETTAINECRHKDIDKMEEKQDSINPEDQEDDFENVSTTVRQPEETESERKQPKQDPEEDERKKKEQASAGFVSFRKLNPKKYRKSSEHGDT